jgi:hypothetical protein
VITKNTLTPKDLDGIVRSIPPEEMVSDPLPKPKKWVRVDCGQIEVYVGDRLYIVALVEKIPDTEDEVVSAQLNVEQTVVKYLRSEGFIDNDYAYVGMQRFQMNSKEDGEETY